MAVVSPQMSADSVQPGASHAGLNLGIHVTLPIPASDAKNQPPPFGAVLGVKCLECRYFSLSCCCYCCETDIFSHQLL